MVEMIVKAHCAGCGEERKFMEFRKEPCGPMSEGEKDYGFRCLRCKHIERELTDAAGRSHRFVDGEHVVAA